MFVYNLMNNVFSFYTTLLIVLQTWYYNPILTFKTEPLPDGTVIDDKLPRFGMLTYISTLHVVFVRMEVRPYSDSVPSRVQLKYNLVK